MQISKRHADEQYARVLATKPSGLGVTSNNLRKLLHSLDFVGWSSREDSGRLDRRALTRFAAGSKNIFSRRELVEAETSAISILIDCSGSMNDLYGKDRISRIETAQAVAIHLSKVLQQARVPFTVVGFQGSLPEVISNSIVVQTPHLIDFKPWGVSAQRATSALGYIHHSANSCTPDYSAIALQLEDLHRRPEGRKILFLLTDAQGYVPQHMIHLQALADKLGIVIIAIGIATDEVTKVFVNATCVRDISQLAEKSFNALLATVRKKL
jgi:cobalamin biosynthesis protein CobT